MTSFKTYVFKAFYTQYRDKSKYAIIYASYASGLTIGPADPLCRGAPFQGGAKLLESVEHFSENFTVVLAKISDLG